MINKKRVGRPLLPAGQRSKRLKKMTYWNIESWTAIVNEAHDSGRSYADVYNSWIGEYLQLMRGRVGND